MEAGRAQRYLQPGTPRKERMSPDDPPSPHPHPSESRLGRQVLLFRVWGSKGTYLRVLAWPN